MMQSLVIDALTTEEQQELEYHEVIVERGLKASEEARQSLRTIQERRLYRVQYRNFEQYCQQRWGFSRQYAYNLIGAEKLEETLSTVVDKKFVEFPNNEWQARPLTQLEPDQQREAWQRAVETAPNGKITGAHVENIVRQYQELPKAMIYERQELAHGVVQCSRCQQLYDGTAIEFCPYCAYTREQRIQHLEHERIKNQVHFSSETPEWYTPQHIIDRVLMVLGEIDLDPCSNNHDAPNVPARHHLTQEDDGLSHQWLGRIYMNPPYGREITDWINHLCQEWEAGRITEAIALVPARTDTEWFRQLCQFPRCFVWGRLHFSEQDNGAPFPSMLVYLGDNLKKFIVAFENIGDIYQRIDNEY